MVSDTIRRLSRIRTQGFYPILALDHGLTVGFGDGVPPQVTEDLARLCASDVSAVVVNYGIARACADKLELPLILQCFGAPLSNPRRKIATLEQALRLDAAAVAVQLDLRPGTDVSSQTSEIAGFVSDAHSMGVPVLFMASYGDTHDLETVAGAIRVCHELGADLIKVPFRVAEPTSDEALLSLAATISMAPPVLLAGGEPTPDILSRLKQAKRIGFSGYCIGRSIFRAPNPQKAAAEIRAAFYNESSAADGRQ